MREMKCVTEFCGTTKYGLEYNCSFKEEDCDVCRECHEYVKEKMD
jgi:ribosome-binding protein aMBF1 (putative translation factor)